MTGFNYRLRRQEKGETEALRSVRPISRRIGGGSQSNAPKCRKSEIKVYFPISIGSENPHFRAISRCRPDAVLDKGRIYPQWFPKLLSAIVGCPGGQETGLKPGLIVTQSCRNNPGGHHAGGSRALLRRTAADRPTTTR
jgi:hypothetical protein